MIQKRNVHKNQIAFPYANPGKNIEISVGEKKYTRHAIKTHFIEAGGENYIDVIKKYAVPIYENGDIIAISENIISLCQNRVVRREELTIGFWARNLSKFVYKSPYGFGVRQPYKMALAIKLAGLPRVLFAGLCSVILKLFGIRGVFYKVVGHNIANIDGFNNLAFDYYFDKGVLAPNDPDGVCREIKRKLGIDSMIVDANDIGVEILGVSSEVPYDILELKSMIKDNPAGQDREMTPMILIRESVRIVEYKDIKDVL